MKHHNIHYDDADDDYDDDDVEVTPKCCSFIVLSAGGRMA